MNPNVIKPNSPSRIWRKSRRKRPAYPLLAVGDSKTVSRPECGRNVSVPFKDAQGKRVRTVLNGAFIMQREQVKSRSKYSPK